jgi:hypothetical protein
MVGETYPDYPTGPDRLLQAFSHRFPQLFHRDIHRFTTGLIPSFAQDFDNLIHRGGRTIRRKIASVTARVNPG